MRLQIMVEPAEEPISVTESKAHAVVTHDDDDQLIRAKIIAARQRGEHDTGRVFVTQQWTYYIDFFPADGIINMPKPPLISVETITYFDTDYQNQTLDPAKYNVIEDGTPGQIILAHNESWPETARYPNAIKIDFTAGYGAASQVPRAIKDALLLSFGDLYKNRELEADRVVIKDHETYNALLDRYRVRHI